MTGIGIPTARNVDHVAYTVPDLEQAIAFFTTVVGARLLYRQGPVADPAGDFMLRQLGVHPRASCHVALLRLGPVTNLELFEYRAPGQRVEPPRASDVGGNHIAIRVGDVDAALVHLSGRPGVRIHGRPRPVDGGAIGRCVQLTTPCALRLELVEYGSAAPGRYPAEDDWSTASDTGIPTAMAVDRVCYTVPDLDQAVAFFAGSLGGRLLERTDSTVDAAFAAERYGAARPARVSTAALRLGPVTNVELRQFHTAGRRAEPPRNSDVGGHHVAFVVEDLDRAVAYLRTVAGVEVLGEPQLIAEGGPIDGSRWVYFRAPWGFQLEALALPPTLPYERDTTARRFGPVPHWHNG